MELAINNMGVLFMAQYRTEWKYICTDGQLELIRARLSGLLPPDKHAPGDGTYKVRSLYFDDYKDSCAAGNESGDGLRYKYRIRYYGDSVENLHLERKKKRYGLGAKKSCPLSVPEYSSLLSDDCCNVLWNTDQPLLKEFCTLMMVRGFSPKAIIDYDRTAFAEPVTHIRVTLDRNISASYDFDNFTKGSYLRFPLQNEHQNILEVKFDEILPGWLRQLIESLNVRQTTFSKYYLGRKRLESILR